MSIIFLHTQEYPAGDTSILMIVLDDVGIIMGVFQSISNINSIINLDAVAKHRCGGG